MASSSTPQRAYAAGVSIRFGTEALSPVLTVDAVPQGRPNARDDDAFTGICPDHDVPTTVSQRYVCPDHGTFSQSELIRARDTGEGLVPFTDEEIKSVKGGGDFAEKVMTLTRCPAGSFAGVTRPGSLGYRLRPTAKSTENELKLYAMLLAAVSSGKTAWIGELRLRQSRTLFHLTGWNGELLITEVITDLAPVDEINVKLDAATLKRGVASLLELVPEVDFDASKFGFDSVAAINAVIKAKGKDAGRMPAAAVAPSEQDVIALLEASLPKPAKPKRAPRKLKSVA